MSRRTYIVVSAMAAIGVAALIVKVIVEPTYGPKDALLDLGFELLPAALLFFLLNGVIEKHEESEARRRESLREIRGDTSTATQQLLGLVGRRKKLDLADLRGADLSGATLAGTTLRHGVLDNADLDGLNLANCKIEDVSMKGALVRVGIFSDCSFQDVVFDGADLTGALFVDCTFEEGTDFAAASLIDVRFTRCEFNRSALDSIKPTGAHFLECESLSDDALESLELGGATIVGDRVKVDK